MARPMKKRKVCSLPENESFGPLNKCKKQGRKGPIAMSVDEYETIRLIDYEGLTQEEAAESMDIARTTVQGIYSDARKKLSQVLVEARRLEIVGGNYSLCDGTGPACRRLTCRRKTCRKDGRDEISNSSKGR